MGALDALDQMAKVAQTVNESKRDLENSQGLKELRETLEGLAEIEAALGVVNTRCIMQQPIGKISHGRNQERLLVLLDKMIVYSKEKRNGFIVKGFILLDNLHISEPTYSSTDDSIVDESGMTLATNASKDVSWIMGRRDASKRYVIVVKNSKEKQNWLNAIKLAIQKATL